MMTTLTRCGILTAVALAWVAGSPARATEPACPPVEGLPGYEAGAPTLRAYAAASFRTGRERAGRQDETSVAGAFCSVMYTLAKSSEAARNPEIQSVYRQRLAHLGAELLAGDDRTTVARLVRDGHETWVAVDSQESEINLTVVTRRDPKPTLTAAGPGDYRLFGHMPGYAAGKPVERPADTEEFEVRGDGEMRSVPVQGRVVHLSYRLEPGAAVASDAEIQFNYREALKARGAELLFADGRSTDARLADGGRTVWVKIDSHETGIELTALEENAPDPALQAVSAGALATALERTGHAALHLGFDPGKAVLKPETKATVAEVVQLLRHDRTLRLALEGHTDDIGPAQANADLSDHRAAALVQAIEARGIAADRLSAAGLGPADPVASNLTSEGRARNTRIELVKQ